MPGSVWKREHASAVSTRANAMRTRAKRCQQVPSGVTRRQQSTTKWREENCSAGGGGDTEAHFPNPLPSLAAVTGGGVQGGGARPAVPGGGGGGNPTSMAQNDTHIMGGGGGLLVEKTFSGQNLCSCAFGANIRSYIKQRARHGTPFLQAPPPSFGGRPCHPPPPPAEQFSGRQASTAVARAHTCAGANKRPLLLWWGHGGGRQPMCDPEGCSTVWGAVGGGGGPPPPSEGGGGDPSPPPWLTQTQHLFRQAPSKRANTQS